MHPKKNSSNNAREQAYKSLLKIDREGAFSNLEIRQTLSRLSFNAEDANLYTLLVYGVLQNQIFLDYCLDQLIKEQVYSWTCQTPDGEKSARFLSE